MAKALLTAERFYDRPAGLPFSRRAASIQAKAKRVPLPPESLVAEPAVAAYVNHGRWVVDCPFCPGALVASFLDQRFLCATCFNGSVGGAMVAVTFPDDYGAIEAELLKRPNEINRNWRPGETVADLVAEREASENGLPPGPATPALDLAALLARIEQLEAQQAGRAP